MDFTVIENLIKEFKNIQMSPIEDVLDILNARVGVEVYYLFNNNIFLKRTIDENAMKAQGFVSNVSSRSPCIENFYPLNVISKYGSENNVTIVPDDIPIPSSISIAAKKQFLIDYFNNLKTNSRGDLTSLTHRKKTIQKQIDEINNNKEERILNYFRSNSFVTEQEFIKNDFIIVELPIFPTDRMYLAAIKRDKLNSLRYAHDIYELNREDYINDIKSKERYFILSPYTVSKYQLTALDKSYVLDIFPDIYDDSTEKNDLEEELINIEKERTFIKDLKIEENFIKLIDFIEDNII